MEPTNHSHPIAYHTYHCVFICRHISVFWYVCTGQVSLQNSWSSHEEYHTYHMTYITHTYGCLFPCMCVSFEIRISLLIYLGFFWYMYVSFDMRVSLLTYICLFWNMYFSFDICMSLLTCVCLFWYTYVAHIIAYHTHQMGWHRLVGSLKL